MKKLALTVAVAVAMVASSGMRCEAQSMINSILEGLSKQPRSIQTEGTASVYVVPDEVVLKLGVLTSNSSVETASSENRERTKELLGVAKKYGIDAGDVQTPDIRVTPQHKFDSFSGRVTGYQVQRYVVFNIKDISKVEAIL